MQTFQLSSLMGVLTAPDSKVRQCAWSIASQGSAFDPLISIVFIGALLHRYC